jgi:HSP20 family protein
MAIRFGSTFSSPFDRLLGLQREMERAFENPVGLDLGFAGRGVFPSVNVFQDKEGYLVRVEVPGVAPEKLAVETTGQTLTISGERETNQVEGSSYHRRERDAGKFSRSLTLPSNLDAQGAQASYKHGVLSIRVPLKAAAKPRQIEVQAA